MDDKVMTRFRRRVLGHTGARRKTDADDLQRQANTTTARIAARRDG